MEHDPPREIETDAYFRPPTWHAGEVALQTRVGAASMLAAAGPRIVRDHLIEQHRDFYPRLPMIVIGAVDANGDAWATLRAGRPGFLDVVDSRTLHVGVDVDAADPAEAGLSANRQVALLGIEPATRRRNRLNGTLGVRSARGFDVRVEQSFGNCPKYIQQRDYAFVRDPATKAVAAPIETTAMDDAARRVVAGADTFFVASYVDGHDVDGHDVGRPDVGRQIDVSHRGGRRGFVRVGDDGVLSIPDFAGNRFFNTLGNIVSNPRVGLVFVDFETGDLLQMTGDASLLLEPPTGFEGAERSWTFAPRRVIRRPGALPLRWTLRDGGWSPFALATGAWATNDSA